MSTAVFDTPTGPVRLRAAQGAVTGLSWAADGADTAGDTAANPPGAAEAELLAEAGRQLAQYFAGVRRAFDLPLAPRGGAFQLRFYAALSAIPYGDTRTYGEIAEEMGVSAQAIGQACGANPIPILIPCHRVLGAKGLGGFSGGVGVETKVALLRLEGAAGLLI